MRVKIRTTQGGIKSIILTGQRRVATRASRGDAVPALGPGGVTPDTPGVQAGPVRPPPLWGGDAAVPPPNHDPDGRNER
jgi:hypothetical protein